MPCRALRSADIVVGTYGDATERAVVLEKELEAYYLSQEAYIRKRVALLDEMQSTITDERRCLEVQHQECRAQISAARKNVLFLQTEQGRMGQMLKKPHATLDREEKTIDQKLSAVQKQIDAEDEVLQQLLAEKEKLDAEEAATEARELRQYQEEKELEKALHEMNNLAKEISQRKASLEKKNHTITEWDEALEARERELARCQDQLHVDLRKIEEDERRFGVKQNISYANALVPTVSQREIMDDFDMSIEHEDEREEIDKEEDYSYSNGCPS